MQAIDYVRLMQNYIEAHLCDKITLADLANVTHYSPWYCYQMFLEQVGLSVSQYVRKLKLSQSALKLRDDNVKIIDVAFEYGFDSVDGYQRAFKKEFGINPYQYSRNPLPISLFTPYKKYVKKEINVKELSTVFVSVVTKPVRKVIIKRGVKATHYMDYCYEVGCDVWGVLKSMPSLCGEPVCMWLPQKYVKPNTSTYVMGVEVALDYDGVVPQGYDVVQLEEATYLQFSGAPFAEEDYEQAISDVWQAMDKYNPSLLGYAWDEQNPRIQLEPIGKSGYVELKAVKKA